MNIYRHKENKKLYTIEEFEALPKPENSFAFLDKDDYKDEKQRNSECQ